MTKDRVIARLWSHITDLLIYIKGTGGKSLEDIEKEMDLTEYGCRRFSDDL